MKIRPWTLVILALIHVLGPVGNTLVSAHLQHASVLTYLKTLLRTESVLSLVDFFALMPIAGVAIYLCKKWSYPVFIAIACWTAFSNLQVWSHQSWFFPAPLLVLSLLLDVLFVGYFLLPAVRTTYFDRSVRWWEQQPRYIVEIEAALTQGDGAAKSGLIRDLSLGGAFVEMGEALKSEKPVRLSFLSSNESLPIELDAVLVYHRTGERGGYGMRFTPGQAGLERLRVLTSQLKKARTPTRLSVDRWTDFLGWARGLVKTGKGLVPELPRRNPSTPSADATRAKS